MLDSVPECEHVADQVRDKIGDSEFDKVAVWDIVLVIVRRGVTLRASLFDHDGLRDLVTQSDTEHVPELDPVAVGLKVVLRVADALRVAVREEERVNATVRVDQELVQDSVPNCVYVTWGVTEADIDRLWL